MRRKDFGTGIYEIELEHVISILEVYDVRKVKRNRPTIVSVIRDLLIMRYNIKFVY